MTKLLWSLILLSLTLACGKGFDKKNKSTTNRTQEEQEVDTNSINLVYLDLLNEYRIDQGLRPLNYSPEIEKVAKDHSKGMAKHTRPFGHMGMSQRCRKIKKELGPLKACGEIIAMGQKTAKAVLTAWINSPKHHKALTDPQFNTTALGIYKDDKGVIYWTQIFVEL